MSIILYKKIAVNQFVNFFYFFLLTTGFNLTFEKHVQTTFKCQIIPVECDDPIQSVFIYI